MAIVREAFQAMPFLEAGGHTTLGWGDDQLALACASHGGEPEHVAVAKAMLHDIGLEEGTSPAESTIRCRNAE